MKPKDKVEEMIRKNCVSPPARHCATDFWLMFCTHKRNPDKQIRLFTGPA